MTMSARNGLSIAAVERETGFSKDTLRIWERRYDFPLPARDAFGERIYSPEQVEKLRLIKRLMDQGHRPGKIVGIEMERLQNIAKPKASAEVRFDDAYAETEQLQHFIALCKTHRVDDLRRDLSQSLLRVAMRRFVTDIVAPLTTMAGDYWAKGNLAVFEEHLYTESVQMIMRNAISSMAFAAQRPGVFLRSKILLTTVPNEPHGLGLLMAEAIFALEGASCVSLGVQTSISEIARAARVQSANIVALSFSASMRRSRVMESLGDLRSEIDKSTKIWVGGRSAVLVRRPCFRQGAGDALASRRTRRLAPTPCESLKATSTYYSLHFNRGHENIRLNTGAFYRQSRAFGYAPNFLSHLAKYTANNVA